MKTGTAIFLLGLTGLLVYATRAKKPDNGQMQPLGPAPTGTQDVAVSFQSDLPKEPAPVFIKGLPTML